MDEYFQARIAQEQKERVRRIPFRRKFFVDECSYDSRKGQVEFLKSERIFSVSSGDAKGEAITEIHDSKHDDFVRQRYNLITANGRRLIHSVDIACPKCVGKAGENDCAVCSGMGWINLTPPDKPDRPPSPIPPPRTRF
jgi:hypothetical protein